jgi:hypothetical protein
LKTHILFGHSSGSVLKEALKIHKLDENIVVIGDDLMWGPLGNFLLEMDLEVRIKWWEQVLNEEDKSYATTYLRSTYKNLLDWVNSLTGEETLLFWVGDSPTEYTGLMFLLANIPKTIPVSIVMVSSAYYKRYGRFKPLSAGETIPEKLFPLMEDAKSLSSRVREGYLKNWTQLLEDNGLLRIRKNRQVETVSETYFDEELLKLANKICKEKMYSKFDGFFPVARLVGEFIGRQKQKVTDISIEWRIRCLIQNGDFAYKGNLTHMRFYNIKPVTTGETID